MQTLMIGTTFNTATSALATDCIDQAEDEINKHISKRYNVSNWNTSTSVPPMITTLAKWLSVGFTYEGGARGGKDAFARADRYIKRAMKNLVDIRDGKQNIVNSSGSAISELENGSFAVLSNSEDYANTFDEDDSINWRVDPDKISAISDERD